VAIDSELSMTNRKSIASHPGAPGSGVSSFSTSSIVPLSDPLELPVVSAVDPTLTDVGETLVSMSWRGPSPHPATGSIAARSRIRPLTPQHEDAPLWRGIQSVV
jgi:hypothetical protein